MYAGLSRLFTSHVATGASVARRPARIRTRPIRRTAPNLGYMTAVPFRIRSDPDLTGSPTPCSARASSSPVPLGHGHSLHRIRRDSRRLVRRRLHRYGHVRTSFTYTPAGVSLFTIAAPLPPVLTPRKDVPGSGKGLTRAPPGSLTRRGVRPFLALAARPTGVDFDRNQQTIRGLWTR